MKSFFEITLQEVRDCVGDMGLKARCVMSADANRYRQSLSLLKQQTELVA